MTVEGYPMVENVEDAEVVEPEAAEVEGRRSLELFNDPLPAAYAWAREGKDQPPVLIKPAKRDGYLGIEVITQDSAQPGFIKGPMALSFASLPGQDRQRASQAITIETGYDRELDKQELGLWISPRTFHGGRDSSSTA